MKVIKQNHFGDSPHTVAKLIVGLLNAGHTDIPDNAKEYSTGWYRDGGNYPEIYSIIGLDLQNNVIDSEYYYLYNEFVCLGLLMAQQVYDQLGANLSMNDYAGEGLYYGFPKPILKDLVKYDQKHGTGIFDELLAYKGHTGCDGLALLIGLTMLPPPKAAPKPIKIVMSDEIICNDGVYRSLSKCMDY